MKSSIPENEIEDGIAAAFGRKYKMPPERTGKPCPNFNFFESKMGLDRGRFRGAALVKRVHGNMADTPPASLDNLFWGDVQGMILIGFDDVAAFKVRDRLHFTVVSERRGLYA